MGIETITSNVMNGFGNMVGEAKCKCRLEALESILPYFGKELVFVDATDTELDNWESTVEDVVDVYDLDISLVNYDEYRKGEDDDLLIDVKGEFKGIESGLLDELFSYLKSDEFVSFEFVDDLEVNLNYLVENIY